jgi:predicted solute-binding protein
MPAKVRLAVSEASYLKPLLYGLESSDSPFDLSFDLPAVNSIRLNERTENTRCAFLSPIDFARYGGLYRIVPHVCVASSSPTNTISLIVKPGVRNIQRVAVDVRVTSEIVLAKIILAERFLNAPGNRSNLEFIPMIPNLELMLQKADAALVVNTSPTKPSPASFTLDLVEEWSDMTGLPYVHGFWVAREDDLDGSEIVSLISARDRGLEALDSIAEEIAMRQQLSPEECSEYLASFAFGFGQEVSDSLAEFIQYAYLHTVISDAPEAQYFDVPKLN